MDNVKHVERYAAIYGQVEVPDTEGGYRNRRRSETVSCIGESYSVANYPRRKKALDFVIQQASAMGPGKAGRPTILASFCRQQQLI